MASMSDLDQAAPSDAKTTSFIETVHQAQPSRGLKRMPRAASVNDLQNMTRYTPGQLFVGAQQHLLEESEHNQQPVTWKGVVASRTVPSIAREWPRFSTYLCATTPMQPCCDAMSCPFCTREHPLGVASLPLAMPCGLKMCCPDHWT